MSKVDRQFVPVAYLPNGQPAPVVLTAEETIELLRLDGNNPGRTLKYWRDEGQLQGVRLGRKVRYRLVDVQEFLARKVGENGD